MNGILPAWQHYLLAIGLFLLAIGLRFLLLPVESGLPYLMLFPALVACALVCHWRATLLYIALAVPVFTYFFNPPHYAFGANDMVPIAASITAALIILALIEIFKRRAPRASTLDEKTALNDKQPTLTGLWFALCLLAVLGITTILQDRRERDDAHQVAQTLKVQTHLNAILSHANEAETGMRGFLITGQDTYLEPYAGANLRIADELQVLRQLTHDNALQQQRLERLERLLQRRLDRLGADIATYRREGSAAVHARISTNVGMNMQNEIRAALGEMIAAEASLLQARQKRAHTSANASLAVTILSLAGAFAALSYTVWRLLVALRERRLAENEVQRLNVALASRSDELELRLQLAARASNTGFWDWDLRSNAVYFSPEWKSQLGYAEAEIQNRFDEWQSRLHPDDLSGALQRVQSFIAAPQGVFETEFRMRHRDGSYRWILARAKVMLDAAGTPNRMLGAHIDITERKQSEAALIASEQKLRLVIDGIGPDMFMGLMTPEGTLIEANLPAIKAGGLTLADVMDKPFHETYWWSHSPEVQAQLHDAILRAAQGEASHYDVQVRLAGKRLVWIDFSLQPLFNDRGEVVYLVPSAVIIESRKQAETALQESKDLLQLFIEQAPVSLAMLDRDMCYLSASHQWRQDYFLGEREMLGRAYDEIFPEISAEWKAIYSRGLAGETVRADEDRFERQDGTVQWLKWIVLPWRDSSGAVGGIIIFSEDITLRKTIQKLLTEKEMLLSEAQRLAHIGSWTWRLADDHLTWSEETYRIYGLAPENPAPTPDQFIARIHPDDRSAMQTWITDCAAGMKPTDLEFRAVLPDGTLRVLHGFGELQRDSLGTPSIMVGAVQDITEQIQAQEKIAAQLDELLRWQKLTLGREGRVIELKSEVNKLLAAQGQPPRYGDLT